VPLSFKDLEIGVGNFRSQPFSKTFEARGLYFIRGKNGAGKTTLLRTLLGRVPIVSGTFSDLQFPVGAIGIEPCFFGDWTVEQNARWLSSLLSKPITLPEEIVPLAFQKFYHLSQGLKRQAELSLNLALELPTYFLDEPLSPLDREQRERYAKKIVERAQNALVLLTTHFEEELFGEPRGVIQL
jgi:ABC-2 type transport system ATP-binding protein